MTDLEADNHVGPVVALAGRRIDVDDEGRFPLANVTLVRERLALLFEKRKVSALAASAACGADLIALDAAGQARARRRIVLPFEPVKFRVTSVVDRPGDWGPLYDRIIDEVAGAGDLVVLQGAGEGGAAYAAANERIIADALHLAGVVDSESTRRIPPTTAFAAIVWEGRPRGSDDATEQFAGLARRRGLQVEEITTLA